MSFDIVCQIMEASDSLRALGDTLGAKMNIGTNEYTVLDVLIESPLQEVSLQDIRKVLTLPAPSLSRIITRLAQKGYIQRKISEQDSRMMFISLTEEGASAFGSTKYIYNQCVESLFKGISPESTALLSRELLELQKRIAHHR